MDKPQFTLVDTSCCTAAEGFIFDTISGLKYNLSSHSLYIDTSAYSGITNLLKGLNSGDILAKNLNFLIGTFRNDTVGLPPGKVKILLVSSHRPATLTTPVVNRREIIIDNKFESQPAQLQATKPNMISCKEAVGLNNKIGTCWNVTIQTNMFYGHNSEIIQKKLSENSIDELLNPTVIENLERFLPPFVLDDIGKISERTLQLLQKIVINLKKRFDIKNKQKVTKMQNAEEDVCERDFVYYVMELIDPGKRNKQDSNWAGTYIDSFFLTNILNIILLNKLTHIVKYDSVYLSNGNKISLNIDKIKNIGVYVYQSLVPLDIRDFLTQKQVNHVCQFFECGGTTKYSNNNIIIEHDWRMFFKILNMLSVTDYDSQKNDSGFTIFSEYDTTPNLLTKYKIWENLSIGPYIVTYDSELKPSIMYSFSPFFKKEKITNSVIIYATSQLLDFHFSYNIECTHENIKKLIGLNVEHYLFLDMIKNNTDFINKLLDLTDVNILDKDKNTIIIKGIKLKNIIFLVESLKRINRTILNNQNKNGFTALIIALSYKNIPMIKEIMKYNPDLTLKDKQGFDVTHYANYYKIDLNDLITPEFQNLKKAINDNNLGEVISLLDKLKYINETDSNGLTALMYAVETTKNLEIVTAILKKNPDLSIKTQSGKTALDLAKDSGRSDIVDLLQDYKPISVKPPLLKAISSFNSRVTPVNVKPVNVKPISVNVKPVNVKPISVNVKPKRRNEECDYVDTLTVVKINEVFKEIGKPIPAAKILKAERLQILKDLLGC
jgi:ankyrin repeat protein